MKKKFESAEVRVIQFEAMDVVTGSEWNDQDLLDALYKLQNVLNYDMANKIVKDTTNLTVAMIAEIKKASSVGNDKAARNQISELASCLLL